MFRPEPLDMETTQPKPKARETSWRRIAFIGNYLPRQCGIATFTSDLCETFATLYRETTCWVIAVNDNETGYAYSSRVRFELAEQIIASYRQAADFLNLNDVDLACLQHEYGIFGGTAGSHILALLRELHMPIVTTLHTVLRDPDSDQRKVLEEIAHLSDRLIVMSRHNYGLLQEIYHVPAEKVDWIPHGIPDMGFGDPSLYKDQFGVEGKIVLLTFGLLSPNKGIETVIEALPIILDRHPNVTYLVLGATHPRVKLREGEAYRLALQRLAQDKGVDRQVIFHNHFVSLEELIQYIGAADVYITPYLNPAQGVSGTLAYMVGAGKVVISTPYPYAQELLADGRGVLVPFRDPEALAACVIDLVEDEARRHAMRKQAYLFGRDMIWPRVAQRYMASFERARVERLRFPRPAIAVKTLASPPLELPPLNLDHLRRMTDSTGILQHAIFTVPNCSEGYTTDDNSRALVVTVLLEELSAPQISPTTALASRYLAFLWYAFDPQTGRFRNFLDYSRRWLDQIGSDDSHGRALWALGIVVGRANNRALHAAAGRLFDQALPAILNTSSPRAWAFALMGSHEYSKCFEGDHAVHLTCEALAERLIELYRANHSAGWLWFDEGLAYANAV
jgi:glycosyltransferase involved in cell wall biosynthesis